MAARSNIQAGAVTTQPASAPIPPAIRVAVVEDDRALRGTLSMLIEKADGCSCVGAYGDGESALRQIPRVKPDVVLMDIVLPPGMSGIECVALLKGRLPSIRVIMLTVFEDSDRIFRALSAGANGYILKRMGSAKILEAVRFVHGGGAAMTSLVARRIVEEFKQPLPAGNSAQGLEKLSAREKAVLEQLAEGFLVKEIADQLGVGFGTVRTYIRRIYEKLHVRSRAQAAAHYYQYQSRPPADTRLGA